MGVVELGNDRNWWERPGIVAAMLALCALPLLWPTVAPLTDLPGHMARWHIAMALDRSPALARYYGYAWQLIGNLGLDLIVPPVARLIGLEPATKLVVLLIPVLTAAGMLWSAREAHGRLPPSAFLALPFAYAWPFQLGFVNFALAQALAFCALALWLRLGRSGRLRLRAGLFAPLGCAVWVAHSAGWGMLGLLAFGAEAARQRRAGRSWTAAAAATVVQCLPLALPVALTLLTRDPSARGAAGDWFDVAAKFNALLSALRDRWRWFDIGSVGLVLAALYVGGRERRLGLEAALALPALLCAAAFLLLPRLMLGGAYVDMRMLPAALALALLAIRPPAEGRLARAIAVAALGFLAVRTAGTTLSFALRAAEQQRLIAVVDAIPEGAAVLALVYKPCETPWSSRRPDHLPAFAILRKDAFVNEQWDLAGQQLVRIRHAAAAPFTADPSQLAYPAGCPAADPHLHDAVARFPRAAFDHVWTIDAPALPATVRGLRPIARQGTSVLYRIVG